MRWEYKTTFLQLSKYAISDLPSDPVKEAQELHTTHLQEMGDEEWELVACIFFSSGEYKHVFKRPKQEWHNCE